ncbi:hypothetical protein L7F22_055745 [Adiantum nelumboides]|nr:hypothetical protein [Adiantum nelumboides]
MDDLPDAVVQNILSRLDLPSLCSAASSCRHLLISASLLIPHLDNLHLLELVPRLHDLRRLLHQNFKLRILKLNCLHLTDEALTVFLKPSLEELHLLNCDWFSSKLLSNIGERCTRLRSLYLDLGWCEESQSNSSWSVDFEALLEHCRFLESLSLIDQNFSLDFNAYAAITRLVSRKLTVLSLGYFPEIYAKELFNFTVEHIQSPKMQKKIFQLQNLQKLSLVLDRITDTIVMLVCESLPSLTDLELQDEPGEEPLIAFDLTTTGIQHLGVFSKLKRLSLARSQDLYPATFKRVEDLGFLFLAEKCTKLESITLAGFSRISDASCRQILHSFSNLHTFELLKSSRITDLTFRDFSAVPVKLVSVTLASCNLLSNSSIRQLSHCKDLESLNLKGCKSIGDKGLEAIASLKRLKKLILNGVDISDMGLVTLGKGTTPLAFLSLRGCQRVSDDGISALVEGSISDTLEGIDLSNITLLTDKAVLSLVHSGMRIVDLKLRDCYNIGDTSLMALASMTSRGCGFGGSLRLLDLWNCKGLTALGMSWLKKPYFPRLRWLGLGWNTVPKSMLDFLSMERPYVHILDHGVELGGRDGEEWSGRYERESA